MPVNARNSAGTSRDKAGISKDNQGQGRDKQRQTGTRPSKCPKVYTNRFGGEQNVRQKQRKFCQILIVIILHIYSNIL